MGCIWNPTDSIQWIQSEICLLKSLEDLVWKRLLKWRLLCETQQISNYELVQISSIFFCKSVCFLVGFLNGTNSDKSALRFGGHHDCLAIGWSHETISSSGQTFNWSAFDLLPIDLSPSLLNGQPLSSRLTEPVTELLLQKPKFKIQCA